MNRRIHFLPFLIFSSPLEKEGIEGRFEKNSLFHRKCEKICKIKNSDYNYKNSLFHRICEFHYFSELLDNKVDKNAITSMNRVTTSHQGKMTYSKGICLYFVKKSQRSKRATKMKKKYHNPARLPTPSNPLNSD